MNNGTISVLNVGSGDTKLVFDKDNQAETIRARRIIRDMLRRGYALLIEVTRNGEKKMERVVDFDESVNEYIIADFDPMAEESVEYRSPEPSSDEKPSERMKSDKKTGGRSKKTSRRARIPVENTKGVAVAPSSGG